MQMIKPYRFSLVFLILIFLHSSARSQIIDKIRARKDSVAARIRRTVGVDSSVGGKPGLLKAKRGSLATKIYSAPSFDSMKSVAQTSLLEQRLKNKEANKSKEFHTSWLGGRVPDFTNAYTLNKHEVRLSVFGRSAYGLTDKLEVSGFLPLVFMPNLNFKYRFVDHPHFAAAYEIGGATGAFPIAVATGIALPGILLEVGTAGVFRGSDICGKVHATWRPGKKVAISLRAGASYFKIRYTGIVGAAGLGGSGGALVGFLPVDQGLIKATWLMGGFQLDYAINKRNIVVLRSSINGINTQRSRSNDTGVNAGKRNYLLYPSLTYTHAWNHFCLTLGVFDIYYPPVVKANKGNVISGSEYVNVYWVLNNGRRTKQDSNPNK